MIEITTYRLLNGVDEDMFAAADGLLQASVFYQLPGLVRRTTARSQDGTWVAIATWADEASADAAAGWTEKAFGVVASTMIDPASVATKRFVAL